MASTDGPTTLPAPLAEALDLVERDRQHGASWLSRQVAQALAAVSVTESSDPSQTLGNLHRAARAFAGARPSMAAIANTAATIWWAAVPSSHDARDARVCLARLHDEASRLLAVWDTASASIRDAARPILTGTIFTHSRSGTVEQALLGLAGEAAPGASRHIIVSESRPGGEGVALARTLAEAGWNVTLVPDAGYALFIAEAGVVVLGADSIRADGSAINKIGSHPLALAARASSTPVYVLCETLKLAPTGSPLILEEMDPVELLPQPIPGVTARNVYFEPVPAHLISGIVTERGILNRQQIASHADEMARAHAALAMPFA